MRIGFGYDVHRLTSGRKLILGGVQIPHDTGLLGHSDADVLIHSVCDALLGALAMGDIGQHFADSDPAFKDIDSRILLKRCYDMVLARQYRIANMDATICAAAPKLAPYITQMRLNIAHDLDCDPEQISIKATTEEGLGISGCGDGMSATVVVLIQPA
ncbi:MAG: 2-C-methyl-D-erythritol 2,4-cyclodiphosphate synthase [Candidatus Cloacimonadaceae bacterium]|jgi:2-C-methyl-D-erythritol 2,4-cyclodiphosphate synthase|nr:2-C-methyl-D-erythritol 2,4-cyclodiphosphate synthase [Candidatus Cloacimonadota bacterium]MDY0318618.1 2-C-methyl-D-erythritol 2,4-cyclodiphosphate synthase [Candidatus Cloacimonadaceae bacterium]